ncbi:hypothetical protein J4230_01895 [Candidatus Woesearchaeota archaeon]|nr:hypothetical protein [Candidatus Woesearchaeota archaeon]
MADEITVGSFDNLVKRMNHPERPNRDFNGLDIITNVSSACGRQSSGLDARLIKRNEGVEIIANNELPYSQARYSWGSETERKKPGKFVDCERDVEVSPKGYKYDRVITASLFLSDKFLKELCLYHINSSVDPSDDEGSRVYSYHMKGPVLWQANLRGYRMGARDFLAVILPTNKLYNPVKLYRYRSGDSELIEKGMYIPEEHAIQWEDISELKELLREVRHLSRPTKGDGI